MDTIQLSTQMAWNELSDSDFSKWKEGVNNSESLLAQVHSNTSATRQSFPAHNHYNYTQYNRYEQYTEYYRYSEYTQYTQYTQYTRYDQYLQYSQTPYSNYSAAYYNQYHHNYGTYREWSNDSRMRSPILMQDDEMLEMLEEVLFPVSDEIDAASLGYNVGHSPGSCPYGTYCNHAASYSEFGYDHSNYKPAIPQIFGMDTEQLIDRDCKLTIYAYDKNAVTQEGTQTPEAKIVKYNVSVRRIVNESGFSVSGRTIVLATGITSEKVDLILDNLDGDGVYEIQVKAYNTSFSDGIVSYEYESPVQTKTFKVKKNAISEAGITNKETFIGAQLGNDKVIHKGLTQTYEEFNASTPISTKDCIFTTVTVTDTDVGDVLKGDVGLVAPDGNRVSTAEIVWENGSNTITTVGQPVTGYAFIPKNQILGLAEERNVPVSLRITDGLNTIIKQCPAGCVHNTSICQGFIDIDTIAPRLIVTRTNPGPAQTADYLLNITDKFASSYNITDSQGVTVFSGALNNKVDLQDVVYKFKQDGTYTITIADMQGQTTSATISFSDVDTIPPTKPTIGGEDSGVITITPLPDEESGIAFVEYALNNGMWNRYSSPVTVPAGVSLKARSVDNAGNASRYTFYHRDLPVTGIYHGDSLNEIVAEVQNGSFKNRYDDRTFSQGLTPSSELISGMLKVSTRDSSFELTNTGYQTDLGRLFIGFEYICPEAQNFDILSTGNYSLSVIANEFTISAGATKIVTAPFVFTGQKINLLLEIDVKGFTHSITVNGAKLLMTPKTNKNFVLGQSVTFKAQPTKDLNIQGWEIGNLMISATNNIGKSANVAILSNPFVNKITTLDGNGIRQLGIEMANINKSGVYIIDSLSNTGVASITNITLAPSTPVIPNVKKEEISDK